MRFSKDFLAELTSRVPLSALVGRAVTWDRRKSQPGRGDFWSCCPFHEEKSPSFHVDDRKGFYHCFGCSASGDHLTFLTEHGGLDFPEAVKALAEQAGVALPERGEESPELAKRRGERGALEAAQRFYEATLWSPAGEAARAYAAGRGLGEETLKKFGFGLAPATQGAASRALAREGISAADLERAGLAVRREGRLADRFVGRLMIPIHDARGKIVGFGGRSLDGREPKYLNSPQGPLFDKSALLFNAHRARGPAHRSRRLFMVEGYLDAVALAEAGIEDVVATCGTALTEAQVALAWTLADEPTLCFDGDRAGRAAAWRAIDRILPGINGGRSFHFLALPDGQDPDDFVRAGGAAAFEALAARKMPLIDAVFEREAGKGADTPERLAALDQRLEALAGQVADRRVGALYRSALRSRAFALQRANRPQSGKARRPAEPPRAPLAPPAAVDRALLDLERLALGLFILRPAFLDRFGEQLGQATFVSDAHAGFAGVLLETYAARLPESAAELVASLPDRGKMCLAEVWGEEGDPIGRRLVERFSILECEPDDDFLARCMTLFLSRLNLRAEMAARADEPRKFARAAAGEVRFLAVQSASLENDTELLKLIRTLDDETSTIRRRRLSPDGTDRSLEALIASRLAPR